MNYNILVINPGSTSTKIAFFVNKHLRVSENYPHNARDLLVFKKLWDQFDYRLQCVLDFVKKNNIDIATIEAVVGRGGLLQPIDGGTYTVNQKMLADAKLGVQGEHISNLGCALAHRIAEMAGCQAFTVDPVSVDEFEPLARYSGHPLIERKALSHTLNIHEVGRRACHKQGIDFLNANMIITHLGGGISIAAVKNGKIIDVNDASGGGPFSPERTGSLPLQQFIDICFSGNYSKNEIKKMVMGEGGLKAYLGTYDSKEVEKQIIQGNTYAIEVYKAMAYQIAKEIGAMATVLNDKIALIVITGGLAHSNQLITWIKERITFLAPIMILAGEFEMEALAFGALNVLEGKEKAKIY